MTLLEVLAATRRYMVLPDNDFSWSTWEDAEGALAEFDGLVAEVERGARPRTLVVLFAPTGPLQELAISSGWADSYPELAARFDALF
ncbi:hypothetical protein [Nocardia goodfellowii]|uniref:Barstar (barnase inhibitor) domain-containing protein n=1 Tax=Nocardia goodfellowii TaxID=882446 RepID=A0ABS4QF17_9NOCA|nr:hypothetical protein [Nocardia goodfellowii]MBP2189740.1 hypothetical protein [Nocardia goodfellowii]